MVKKATKVRPITLDEAVQLSLLDEYKEMEILNGGWVPRAQDPTIRSGRERLAGQLFMPLWLHVEQDAPGVLHMGKAIFILQYTQKAVYTMRRPDIAYLKG